MSRPATRNNARRDFYERIGGLSMAPLWESLHQLVPPQRRPDEPAATAFMLAACGAAGSSVPWLLGVTTSDVAPSSSLVRRIRRSMVAAVTGSRPVVGSSQRM